jgi:hypothetical protein
MDTNLVLRDGSADLTADETLTSVKVGPMVRPMALCVQVPEVSSGDTLDVELEFCDASASTTEIYNMNMKQISAAGYYSIPFFTQLAYLQVKLNVTGSDVDLGATKVWIAPAHRYDSPYNA